MLENSIKSNEYWLVTESFLTELSVTNKKKFSKTVQKLESFGKTKLNYLEFKVPIREIKNRRPVSIFKLFDPSCLFHKAIDEKALLQKMRM